MGLLTIAKVVKIFIHTNNKQILGAKLAKFSFEEKLQDKSVTVEFINVDTIPEFKNFVGKKYLRNRLERVYTSDDLQSFTLSRFMPPQLMDYDGRAIVIDPDIFAVRDLEELINIDLEGKSIAACRKKDAWDTSLMVLDCSKLKHWRIENILKNLEDKEIDYNDLMTLKLEKEENIMEIPRIWNHLDTLDTETRIIHMTGRLTQPWKTGLPIDFTINPLPKIFGIIPREPIHKILGKYPTHYQKHPNENIESWFFSLLSQAMEAGIIMRKDVIEQISQGNVRRDILEKIPH